MLIHNVCILDMVGVVKVVRVRVSDNVSWCGEGGCGEGGCLRVLVGVVRVGVVRMDVVRVGVVRVSGEGDIVGR